MNKKYSATGPLTDPWTYAIAENRSYLSPEDIGAAIRSGARKEVMLSTVLNALGTGACEDASLCAFVANGLSADKYRSEVDMGWITYRESLRSKDND